MYRFKFLWVLPLLFFVIISSKTAETTKQIQTDNVKNDRPQNALFDPLDYLNELSTPVPVSEEKSSEWDMYDPFAENWDSVRVTTTVYLPFPPMTNITASGLEIDTVNTMKHRWLAVSRDLQEKGFTFGTKVMITGTGIHDGIWEVQDLMNKRWSKRIDLLVDREHASGKWENVKMVKLN